MIILENREKRLVSYEIPVAIDGGQTHHLARVHRSSDAQARSAGKELSVVARKLPTTLTLTAKGTKGSASKPLSDDYATIPAIAAAIKDGRLVKSEIKPTTTATAEKTPAQSGDGK